MADDDPDDAPKPMPAEQVAPADDLWWVNAPLDDDDPDDAPMPTPAEEPTPESIYDVRLMRTPDAAAKLRHLEEEYSDDPDFDIAWRAIDYACQCGLIQPDWLRAYLGQAASAIVGSFREARRSKRSSGSEGDRILKALGYNRGRGHRSPSTKLLIRDRDRNMFEFVAGAVRSRGLDNAYNLVAADFRVSRETVVDGVKRHLHRLKDWEGFREVPSTMEEYVALCDEVEKRRDEIRKRAEKERNTPLK